MIRSHAGTALRLLVAALLTAGLLSLPACSDDRSSMDEMIEEVKDEANDAKDEIQDEIDDHS